MTISVADKSYDKKVCSLNDKEIALKQLSVLLTPYEILLSLIGYG